MGVDSSPKPTQQNEKVPLLTTEMPKSYNQQENSTLIPLKVRTGTQGKY